MGTSRYLVLTAMIFAVAMMSIDQTIVSIAAPTIQRDLALTSTGLQWVINGYLLALAAFFAFGGKLSDVVGHRKMVIVGTVAFAAASVLCGATPKGSAAQAWLIAARILQGASGALLFPAALAIVFNAFAPRERGIAHKRRGSRSTKTDFASKTGSSNGRRTRCAPWNAMRLQRSALP